MARGLKGDGTTKCSKVPESDPETEMGQEKNGKNPNEVWGLVNYSWPGLVAQSRQLDPNKPCSNIQGAGAGYPELSASSATYMQI